MNVWNWVKQTPLWLVVPSMFISVGVASAVARYEPLVFDPSFSEVQTADAAELSMVDAEALEAANAAGGEAADVQLDAPSSGVGADGALADGTWTGYAACGKGNADNWKPYYVGVTVEVSGGKPQGVMRIFGTSSGNAGDAALSWDADENQKYLDWAISGRNGAQGVKAQLAGESVVSDIDTVSGATYSSAAIFNAYVDALGKSAKAAGGASPVAAKAEPSRSSKAAAKGGKLKSKKKIGVLADGTWTGYAKCGPDPDESWKPYYVGVTLTVKDGKLASIDKVFGSSTGEKGSKKLTYDADENAQYLESAEYGVVAQLEKALSAGKIPSSIDTVSGPRSRRSRFTKRIMRRSRSRRPKPVPPWRRLMSSLPSKSPNSRKSPPTDPTTRLRRKASRSTGSPCAGARRGAPTAGIRTTCSSR